MCTQAAPPPLPSPHTAFSDTSYLLCTMKEVLLLLKSQKLVTHTCVEAFSTLICEYWQVHLVNVCRSIVITCHQHLLHGMRPTQHEPTTNLHKYKTTTLLAARYITVISFCSPGIWYVRTTEPLTPLFSYQLQAMHDIHQCTMHNTTRRLGDTPAGPHYWKWSQTGQGGRVVSTTATCLHRYRHAHTHVLAWRHSPNANNSA